MTELTAVDAWEVLDSRGNPTVRVEVAAGDATGRFTVPAGASTGSHEALELRDGGSRYRGRGVRTAVEHVHRELAPAVVGELVTDQRAIDDRLTSVDGTADLSRLGANAVLGVSGAVAHAASEVRDVPLFRLFVDGVPPAMPVPLINIISGGLHAPGGLAFQDFMVVPHGSNCFASAIELAWEIRMVVRDRLVSAGERPLVADEGGFAPQIGDTDEACDVLLQAIEEAGATPGSDVSIAIDVAASHFFEDGVYRPDSGTSPLDASGMIELIAGLVERYPVVAVEDALVEDDWTGWTSLLSTLPDRVAVIGDDFLVTNTERLERAVNMQAANAVLVKPNQAGTVTAAVDVIDAGARADWMRVVSARSGETCDATIADLAVGRRAECIKIGSLARSERLAKYNRLLRLEDRHELPIRDWPAVKRD